MKFKIKIEGESAYEQNKFSKESYYGTAPKPSSKHEPTEEDKMKIVESVSHKVGDKYVIPAAQLDEAIINAGRRVPFQGRKMWGSVLEACSFVFPDYIPFNYKKFEIAEYFVTPEISRSRGAIHMIRPRFLDWDAEFEWEVNHEDIDAATAKIILEYAGKSVGIGTMRPRIGRFTIKKFETIK